MESIINIMISILITIYYFILIVGSLVTVGCIIAAAISSMNDDIYTMTYDYQSNQRDWMGGW